MASKARNRAILNKIANAPMDAGLALTNALLRAGSTVVYTTYKAGTGLLTKSAKAFKNRKNR